MNKQILYIINKTALNFNGSPLGASEKDIEEVNSELRVMELGMIHIPAVPTGYAEFLKTANGYVWESFQFYGTANYQITEEYYLPGLPEKNKDRSVYGPDMNGKLLLGCFDDNYIFYDGETEKYSVINKDSFSVEYESESFDELFIDFVGHLFELTRNPFERFRLKHGKRKPWD